MKKTWLNKDFILARLVFYLILVLFYLYIVFLNTASCPESDPCMLCGLKTAVYKTFKFSFVEAYQLNHLVVYIWFIMLMILVDIKLIVSEIV